MSGNIRCGTFKVHEVIKVSVKPIIEFHTISVNVLKFLPRVVREFESVTHAPFCLFTGNRGCEGSDVFCHRLSPLLLIFHVPCCRAFALAINTAIRAEILRASADVADIDTGCAISSCGSTMTLGSKSSAKMPLNGAPHFLHFSASKSVAISRTSWQRISVYGGSVI
jgi:hypothetical protein